MAFNLRKEFADQDHLPDTVKNPYDLIHQLWLWGSESRLDQLLAAFVACLQGPWCEILLWELLWLSEPPQ